MGHEDQELVVVGAGEVLKRMCLVASQEIGKACSVKGELTKLLNTVEMIQAVLENAANEKQMKEEEEEEDEEEEEEGGVRVWLRRLKGVSAEVHNLLDEFRSGAGVLLSGKVEVEDEKSTKAKVIEGKQLGDVKGSVGSRSSAKLGGSSTTTAYELADAKLVKKTLEVVEKEIALQRKEMEGYKDKIQCQQTMIEQLQTQIKEIKARQQNMEGKLQHVRPSQPTVSSSAFGSSLFASPSLAAGFSGCGAGGHFTVEEM